MKNFEHFMRLAKAAHDDDYSYDESSFSKMSSPISITCKKHGDFYQIAKVHVRGHGCPECSRVNSGSSQRLTTDEFIAKAKSIHGDEYDYSLVKYVNARTLVSIVCRKHGEFQQRPCNHLDGRGCRICAGGKISASKTSNGEDFIAKAMEVHGDVYDYTKIDYVSAKNIVRMTCKKHGEFQQIPNNHLSGKGCPSCGVVTSKGEQEIFNLVSSFHPDAQNRARGVIPPYELDIYIPSIRMAIEFNGVYWHSTDRKSKGYHQMKRNLCEGEGVRLLSVNEWDWLEKRARVERIIISAIGANNNNSVPARKCKFTEVSTKKYRAFMEENHIQGYAMAKHKFGLIHNDDLVAVMSFNQLKSGVWDMVRYATSCNVQGGQSKLFKYSSLLLDMDQCQSFVDCDYFTGSSYSNSGFIDSGDESISFRVWHRSVGFMSRQAWWKANIPATLSRIGADESIFDEAKTQNQMMSEAGCLVIENSGTKKYIWERG